MNYTTDPYSASKERRSRRRYRLTSWRGYFQERWRRWMDRRMPASRSIQLGHRNLFIFPTRAGFYFLFILLLLLLLAINFENNLVYFLTFWLAGIYVVSIIYTFSCLNGLVITGGDAEPGFAGADAVFSFFLKVRRHTSYGVSLSWQNVRSERCNVEAGKAHAISLRYHTGPRGIVSPGRVKLESTYPLGLMRCWTWIDLQQQVTVYPRPDKDAPLLNASLGSEVNHESTSQTQKGSDDFEGLRHYRAGDSSRHVAWRQYARTGKLSTKDYIDYVDQRMWLDWANTSGNTEQRLSQLCHWAIQSEAGASDYGLKLPGCSIEPGRGSQHLHALLAALAVFETPYANDAAKINASAFGSVL